MMLPKPQFSGLAVLLLTVALCACSQPSIETQIYRPDGRKHVPEFHLDIKRPDLTEWFQQPPWDPNTRVDGFPTQGFLAVRSGAAQPDELWQVGRPQISDRLLQFRLIVRNQNTTTTAHGVLASIELDFTTRATLRAENFVTSSDVLFLPRPPEGGRLVVGDERPRIYRAECPDGCEIPALLKDGIPLGDIQPGETVRLEFSAAILGPAIQQPPLSVYASVRNVTKWPNDTSPWAWAYPSDTIEVVIQVSHSAQETVHSISLWGDFIPSVDVGERQGRIEAGIVGEGDPLALADKASSATLTVAVMQPIQDPPHRLRFASQILKATTTVVAGTTRSIAPECVWACDGSFGDESPGRIDIGDIAPGETIVVGYRLMVE